MRAADLREKSPEDLAELQKSLARDVFQNRLKNFTNRLDDTSTIRKTKRDLARVVTLLRERELGVVRVAAKTPRPVEKPAAKAEVKAETRAEAKAAPAAPEAKAKRPASKKSAPSASAGEAAETPKKKSPKKSAKSEAK
jgi:large subunit ribosomal protein L29